MDRFNRILLLVIALVVTPRIEREIIERGSVVQARRPHPVAAHGHGGPTRQRDAYLLNQGTDVFD